MRHKNLSPTGGAAVLRIATSVRALLPGLAVCAALLCGGAAAAARSPHAATPHIHTLVQHVLPIQASARAEDVLLSHELDAAVASVTSTTSASALRAALAGSSQTLQLTDFGTAVPSLSIALPGSFVTGNGNGNGGSSAAAHGRHAATKLARAGSGTFSGSGFGGASGGTGLGSSFFAGGGGTSAPVLGPQPAIAPPATRSWPPTVLVPPPSLPAPAFVGGASVGSIASVLVALAVTALLLTGLVLRRAARRLG